MGIFYPFLHDSGVRLIGVEAAGRGLQSAQHAATLTCGRPGTLHGSYSMVLQDADGQIQNAYSVAAGLDYPGVGPEHSYLKEKGRVSYTTAHDDDAVEAFADVVDRLDRHAEVAHDVAEADRVVVGEGRELAQPGQEDLHAGNCSRKRKPNSGSRVRALLPLPAEMSHHRLS